jgi:uncharacterized RDD family membrane protein YckC
MESWTENSRNDANTFIEPHYSGFWRRFLALFIDGAILLIPHVILNSIIPYVGSFILFFLYKPVFESSSIRGTPGKALLGMVVVTEDGDRLNFKEAVIRMAMSFVSGMFFAIGYFMNLFTAKRQTLHDLVAHTVVIDQVMPRENFFDIWLDQMRFIFGRGTSEIFTASTASSSSTHEGQTGFSHVVSETDAVGALEKLHKLFSDGVITEAEFTAKKTEILKRI